MAIPDHQIQDHASFQKVTGDPNQIAGLYYFSTLDCLVTLAAKVAHDFFDRPHLYTDLDQAAAGGAPVVPLAPVLARLHAREGYDERFLSEAQRQQIYTGLFGPSPGSAPDAEGDFGRLKRELINACAAFAERVFDTGVEMLRERVRTAHRPFKEYLTGLHGSSVRWSHDEALADLTEETAYRILRNRGIAAVFGIAQPPTSAWPYVEDSNGDKLVEEISRQLQWRSEGGPTTPDGQPSTRPHWWRSEGGPTTPDGQPSTRPHWTRERFSNLQRAAFSGAVAIRTVLDFSESGTNNDLNRLITKSYIWGSALMAVEAPLPEAPVVVVPVPPVEVPAPVVGVPVPSVDGAVVAPGLPAERRLYTP